MTALTFSLKTDLNAALDCSPLNTANLQDKSAAEMNAIKLNYGNQHTTVSELFDVAGDDAENLVFENTSTQMDYVGAKASTGTITINGDVGNFAAYKAKNTAITLNGNAGDFAACQLGSGKLTINGNVGDFLGGASAGQKKGMRGGTVLLKGNAGNRVGDQMRRGMILIEGNTGDYCASRMIAGTIGVLGTLGDYTGFNMKRGTVLVKNLPKLHATMQDCGTHTLPFMDIMLKTLKQLDSAFASIDSMRVQRFVGDAAMQGNGEILYLQ